MEFSDSIAFVVSEYTDYCKSQEKAGKKAVSLLKYALGQF